MTTTSSVEVVPEFTSLGVNRVVNALDWGPNGLIAYCGHHVVCLYDPEVSRPAAKVLPCCGCDAAAAVVFCCRAAKHQ